MGKAESRKRVLVVDDERDIRELLDLTLAKMGLAADCAGTLEEAKDYVKNNRYQLCLTDMRLPDGQGLELVAHIAELSPETPVAVITAHGSMENAVSALKAGAFDYLAKPVSLDQLRSLIKTALGLPTAEEQKGLIGDDDEPSLIGGSQAILEVKALLAKGARSQAPTHICGESGSGKEMAARLIHRTSHRRGQPFVPVNCGAIPENLMESEFFGYRKGAFTGADQDRDGFFQAANGGTLFLDEVADLPSSMQVKLLRVIQERRVRKIGSPVEEAIDVRIVSATHQNLRQLVEVGKFRQDLFYRLNVIEIRMPALRECGTDVLALADKLLSRMGDNVNSVPRLTEAARKALCTYSFPGNVRELENILERAYAMKSGIHIDVDDLCLTPLETPGGEGHGGGVGFLPLQEYLDRVEKQAILEALQKTRYNRTAAAKLLGVTFRSLRYRLERLGLND